MNAQTPAGAAGTIMIGEARVNRLGFGAMRLTGPGIWGAPPDREEAKRVLRRAVELGVDFIDTADAYGPDVNEELIAEALHPYPERLMIATKGGSLRPGPDAWTRNGGRDHLRRACDASLRRLRLEQIPLYQLHGPDPTVPYEESVGALAELQQAGKIRYIGLSNVTDDLLRRAQAVANVVSVQNRYNIADRASEPVLRACEAQGMAFLPWAPVARGTAPAAVLALARERGATPAQIMLAWLLAHSAQVLPIPGTSSIQHLEEDLAAAALSLDRQEMLRLEDQRAA